MTWKKLSEVLANIILDIVIDTAVIAMNFRSFSGYLLLGKLISYLNIHFNITRLPSFCVYVGKQDRPHYMPYESPSWWSLFWFFSVCYTRDRDIHIVFMLLFNIFENLHISDALILISSKPFLCFSIFITQNEDKVFLSLSSIILKKYGFYYCLGCLGECSKTNINVYKRQVWPLRCVCYQTAGRYCTNKMH